MKSTLLTRIAAAALLLAPMGAVLVAQPAAAQVVHPGGNYMTVIERFEMFGAVVPGSQLRFRMVAAPNGIATVSVPGIFNNWEMRETSPGVYEASWTVQATDNLAAFRLARVDATVAGARVSAGLGGSATVPTANAAAAPHYQVPPFGGRFEQPRNDIRRDHRGPVITQVTPANGARVGDRRRTQIAARFTDDASGVDAGSVRLRVDGRDVTGASRVDGDEIRYREDLAPGRHVAELVLRDRAGNVSRHAWAFVVDDRGYGYDRDDRRRW